MKNLSVPAVVAALALSVVAAPSPASADPAFEACESAYMTVSEFNQLIDVELGLGQVARIVGSLGERLRDQSTPDYMVRRWKYCTGDQWIDADQWLVFERPDGRRWVLTEIR